MSSVSTLTAIPYDFSAGLSYIYIHDADPVTGLTPQPTPGSDPGDIFTTFLWDYTDGTLHIKQDCMCHWILTVEWDSGTYKRGCWISNPFVGDGVHLANSAFTATQFVNLTGTGGNEYSTTRCDGLRKINASDASADFAPYYYQNTGSPVNITVSFQAMVIPVDGTGGVWENTP